MNDPQEQEEAYIPVYRASLVPGRPLNCDVYIKFGDEYVLFRKKDSPYVEEPSLEARQQLKHVLFIRAEDRRQFIRYLEQNLDTILSSPDTEANVKAFILVETSRGIMEDLFEAPEAREGIGRASNLVKSTVDFVLQGNEAFQNLLALCSHDYELYAHSVNVSVYVIALAQRLRYGEAETQDVAMAALLHDIGKTKTNQRIVESREELTETEASLLMKHPLYSYEILTAQGLRRGITRTGLEHHEREDGRGYPNQIRGNAMHPYSRICSVANVFDNLTTTRPGGKALLSFEALKKMKFDCVGQFDQDILNEMIVLMRGELLP